LTKDAKKTITDNYGRVIESSKDLVGPDNYSKLKDQYLDRFIHSDGDTQATAPHGGKYPPGSVVSVKGKNYTVGADGDSLTPQ